MAGPAGARPCYTNVVVILFICLPLAAFSTTRSAWDTLQAAVNANHDWKPVSFWGALKRGETRLYLAGLWEPETASGSTPPQLPLTVFTAASLTRLPQLRQQCASWPGPLVAALWVPLVVQPQAGDTSTSDAAARMPPEVAHHLAEAVHTVQQALSGMRLSYHGMPGAQHSTPTTAGTQISPGAREPLAQGQRAQLSSDDKQQGCDLTVLLFAEVFRDQFAHTFLFPINTLRNYAALMVRTPLMAMIDVDLVINSMFARSLMSNSARVKQLEKASLTGELLVLPAFEARSCSQEDCADGLTEGLAAAQGPKELAIAMFKNGSLDVFHCRKGLHFTTDYKRWITTGTSYTVTYARNIEPWFIGHRSMLPFYDEHYVGFGFNKQVQVMYAAANIGLRIRVLPDAWLVHLPHEKTAASKLFDTSRGRVVEAAAKLLASRPQPSARPPTPIVVRSSRQAEVWIPAADGTGTSPSASKAKEAGLLTDIWSWLLGKQNGRGTVDAADAAGRAGAGESEESGDEETEGEGGDGQEEEDEEEEEEEEEGEGAAERASTGGQPGGSGDPNRKKDDSRLDRYAADFHKHLHKLGWRVSRAEGGKLPDSYLPELSPPVKQLLSSLPWWAEYRQRWPKGQPRRKDELFPNATKMKVPIISSYVEIKALRKKMQVCAP